MTFRAVREDRDSRRAGRKRELARAGFAAPHFAVRKVSGIDGTALGAEGFPTIVREPDSLEAVIGFVVREAQHLGHAPV